MWCLHFDRSLTQLPRPFLVFVLMTPNTFRFDGRIFKPFLKKETILIMLITIVIFYIMYSHVCMYMFRCKRKTYIHT